MTIGPRKRIGINPKKASKILNTRGISSAKSSHRRQRKDKYKLIQKNIKKPTNCIKKSQNLYIVGGGPSLRTFNFEKLKGKDTIAVNKSLLNISDATYFITMDYSLLYRIDLPFEKYINTTKIFVANMTKLYYDKGMLTDIGNNITYDLSYFDLIIKSFSEIGVGYNFVDFRHGDNSGYCALQFGLITGYKNIYLLGIDLCDINGRLYHHDGYKDITIKHNLKRHARSWMKNIDDVKLKFPDVNIYSCSKVSCLNNKIGYKELSTL